MFWAPTPSPVTATVAKIDAAAITAPPTAGSLGDLVYDLEAQAMRAGAVAGSVEDRLKLLVDAAIGSYSGASFASYLVDAWTKIAQGTSKLYTIQPTGASVATLTSGVGVGVYGAWTQIVAAGTIGAASLMGVIIAAASTGSIFWQFDIGQGGAGAEVAVATLPFITNQNTSVGQLTTVYIPLGPPRSLTANARLAARCMDSSGSKQIQLNVVLLGQNF